MINFTNCEFSKREKLQKCERFRECFFPFSKKHNCKKKSAQSLQIALVMRLCKKQRNIYKAFKLVSVVKNLKFII